MFWDRHNNEWLQVAMQLAWWDHWYYGTRMPMSSLKWQCSNLYCSSDMVTCYFETDITMATYTVEVKIVELVGYVCLLACMAIVQACWIDKEISAANLKAFRHACRGIIIIIIITLRQCLWCCHDGNCHCESSPGWYDECRTTQSGRRPLNRADRLGLWVHPYAQTSDNSRCKVCYLELCGICVCVP